MGAALLGALVGWLAADGRGEKAQDVRVADVLLIGPLLVIGAPPPFIRFIGGATVAYNGRTYLNQRTLGGV